MHCCLMRHWACMKTELALLQTITQDKPEKKKIPCCESNLSFFICHVTSWIYPLIY